MNTKPIDIYGENPPALGTIEYLEYNIAVMTEYYRRPTLTVQGRDRAQASAYPDRKLWVSLNHRPTWGWDRTEYRISPECKPAPKMKKVPLELKDLNLEKMIWVKRPTYVSLSTVLVISFNEHQLWLVRYGNITFTTLKEDGWVYSDDGCKTWKPFFKEVPDEN